MHVVRMAPLPQDTSFHADDAPGHCAVSVREPQLVRRAADSSGCETWSAAVSARAGRRCDDGSAAVSSGTPRSRRHPPGSFSDSRSTALPESTCAHRVARPVRIALAICSMLQSPSPVSRSGVRFRPTTVVPSGSVNPTSDQRDSVSNHPSRRSDRVCGSDCTRLSTRYIVRARPGRRRRAPSPYTWPKTTRMNRRRALAARTLRHLEMYILEFLCG